MAKGSFSTKIQFDGEREYKQACLDINNSLKTLNSEMKVVTAEFGANDKSIDGLTKKQDILKRQYEEQTKKVIENEKALAALKEQGTASASVITRFEVALNDSKAALVTTGNQLKATEKDLVQSMDTSKEYTKTVEGIDKSLSVLQAELKTASQAYKVNKEDAGALAKQSEVLNKIHEEQAKKVQELEAAYNKAAAGSGQMSDEAVKLKLDLEKAKQEVGRTDGELVNVQKELGRAGKEADSFGNEVKKAGNESENTGAKLARLGGLVADVARVFGTAMLAIGAGVAAGSVASIKMAADYETSVAKVGTIADTSKKSLQDLSSEAIAASNKYNVAASSINESLYQAISAGADTAEAMGLVEVAIKSAKGGFTDATTAVDGLTTVLNSYAMETKDAEKVANQMLVTQNMGKTSFGELASTIGGVSPTAKAAGVATDELLASIASLTANGIETSSAMTGVKAALSNIVKPSKQAQEAAKKMGVDFSVSAIQAKGWNGFLEELQSKTGGSIDEMSKLFGSTEALNSMLTLTSNSGMQLFKDTITEMNTNTSALDDAYNKMSNTAEEKINKAKNSFQNLGITIGSAMLPAVGEYAAELSGLLSNLTSAFDKGGLDGLMDSLSGVVGSIVTKLSDELPKLTETAAVILTTIAQGIVDNLPALFEATSKIGKTLVDTIGKLAPILGEGALNIVIELANGIGASLPQLVPKLVELITFMIKTLVDNIPLLLDAALKLVSGLADGILLAVPILVTAIPDIVTSIVNALADSIPLIIQAGLKLLTSLVSALPEIIIAIVEAIPKIINGIVAAAVKATPIIIKAGMDLLTSLVKALPEIITAIAKAIPQIIDGAVAALTVATPIIVQAGIELLTSLVDALPEIINAIVEAIPKIIDGVIKALIVATPLIIQAGIDLLIALVDALPTIITTITKAIPQIITSITEALVNNIDKIIEAGIQIFVALIQEQDKIKSGIIKAIPQIMLAIGEAFMNYFSKMAEIGLNLMKGLWEGINNAGAWLRDKISGFFGGVVESIKNFFGIQSPS